MIEKHATERELFEQLAVEHAFPERQLAAAFLAHLGFTNKQIAAALVVTEGTVKRHLHQFRDHYSEITQVSCFTDRSVDPFKRSGEEWKQRTQQFEPGEELVVKMRCVFAPEIVRYIAHLEKPESQKLLALINAGQDG